MIVVVTNFLITGGKAVEKKDKTGYYQSET